MRSSGTPFLNARRNRKRRQSKMKKTRMRKSQTQKTELRKLQKLQQAPRRRHKAPSNRRSKRGRVGSSTAANATRTRKKIPARSHARAVPRSPPRTTRPTIGNIGKSTSSQQRVSKSAPRQQGRKPSSQDPRPASSGVVSSASSASSSRLVDTAKQLQKALADAKEEYKKLKQEQKVLGHHMSIKVKDLVPVLQAYDVKLELCIDEVIKRNEAHLKELGVTGSHVRNQ